MFRLSLLIITLFTTLGLSAQQSFKPVLQQPALPAQVNAETLNFSLRRTPAIAPATNISHLRPRLNPANIRPVGRTGAPGIRISTDPDNGQIFALHGRPSDLPDARPTKEDALAYLAAVADDLGIADPYQELRITDEIVDEQGHQHLRIAQVYAGIPVLPADARLHSHGGGFDLYTGRLQPSPEINNLVPGLAEAAARTQVQTMFSEQWTNLSPKQQEWISGPQLSLQLVIFSPSGAEAKLAWQAHVRPNLLEHTSLFLDAHSGEVLVKYTHTCGFDAGHSHRDKASPSTPTTTSSAPTSLVMDGPATVVVQDLYDRNITLNTFSLQDTFYLLDGTKPMFSTAGGQLSGFILTYNGGGSTPLRDDFEPGLQFSLSNRGWSKTEASVHSNAGAAYQYFLDKHERNSIDGAGGNIYSFMNINETDGTEMDNAFWNGRALFYGNGVDAFQRLPRGLDVAGHEMAHGVIQSTADLIYEEQSGAMNESFADIFGYLIEGETGDYRIGENVVTSSFPSGALRDLRNPNNGGSRLGQPGWQPAHMDEYVNLPNTEEGDRGGVHVNSGITNRAFYLFSSAPNVGDVIAGKVYYNALTLGLTRSSRFADLRLAVVEAAGPFGANVVAAAENAFAGVGIGGEAGDYTVDLDDNEGDRFLLLANTAQSALFLADQAGTLINPSALVTVGLTSRPSVTDDGSVAVFVDDQGRLRAYYFGSNELDFIEGNPQTIWRNIAISKDGDRIAVTTTDIDNRILIFDFVTQQGEFLTLSNPTSASGISTGDVQYADALEWEPSGQFLMYDALSRLDDGLEFWDIGFLRAWDANQESFGDGTIFKLSTDLPAGSSTGNPTFSKNSPYIIAYEEVDFDAATFSIVGANIETGASSTIFRNNKVNYPNYGLSDDRMVFDAATAGGVDLLGIIPLAADKISAGGSAIGVLEGGHWGYFFANGERDLNTSLESPIVEDDDLKIYPTLTADLVTVETGTSRINGPIQVLDMAGRQVAAYSNFAGTQTLSIGHLPQGSYFIAVPLKKGTIIRRVVVR
jgi:Zn-dependent metalloprotease